MKDASGIFCSGAPMSAELVSLSAFIRLCKDYARDR